MRKGWKKNKDGFFVHWLAGLRRVIMKSASGFTLVEMLVVLGITAMLSSVFICYGGTIKDQVSLFSEEAKMVQVLYKAKTYSVQALKMDGGINSGKAACGYGVHFNTTTRSYFIFLKGRDSGGLCPSADSGLGYFNEEPKGSVNVVDSRVFFSGVGDIVFKPPKPEVYFYPNNSFGGKVKLCNLNESFCREVTVNKVGQVMSGKAD